MIENNGLEDETLAEALARCDLQLDETMVEQLDRYRKLLWEWNEKLNLTRHTSLDKFVSRDVVDSLALERFIEPGDSVLDIGTGGGVPGVLLAILRPDLRVTLCDGVAKKANAASDIVERLQLPVQVVHGRAEEILRTTRYDTLVARAVAPLSKILTWLKPCKGQFETLLLVKGRKWTDERHEAREKGLLNKLALRRLYSYRSPGTEAESVILRLVRR